MRALALLSLFLLPSLALADEHCKFQAPQKYDFDLAGVHTLVFDLGHHDMHLNGTGAVGGVEVRGRGCASSEELLKSLRVTQQREGDRLVVKAEGDDDVRFGLFGEHYAWLDLQVRIPDGIAVQVDSGSGDVEVGTVASLDASLGSGDLKVHGVKGAFSARTGSGDIDATDVGSLHAESLGSGDLNVGTVHGDASVGNVGSGDIGIDGVEGNVDVGNVGSGDVTLHHVKGSVQVGAVASGDVEARDIGGDLTVRSVGSGDVDYHDVRGKVSLPRDDD
jgi:hypothetical protein